MHTKPLIIIDTAIIGGPGRGLFQLLSGLKEKGTNYLVCNFRYRVSKGSEFVNEAKEQEINLTQIDQRFRLDPTPIWQVIKIAREGKYNLIQSHGYKSHFISAIVAPVLGLPWIAFAHGWTTEDTKVKFYHSLDRLLLRYATIVVAVSPQLKKVFDKLRGTKKQTLLLLNAIDQNAIPRKLGGQAIRSKLCLNEDSILLGCFGRLSFEKGQDILIKAFAKIHLEHPAVRIVFLGDGPNFNALSALAGELGIADKVDFVSHERNIGDYYEAIDLLVLPSRSEGLPNVVLEAMSFSVPVVASEVGAVSEIINNGLNGWLIPPNDVDALSNQLHQVLSNKPQLRIIGEVACLSLQPKFCPIARTQKILDLYEQI